MANTDAAFGFRPVKMLDGSPYNGATIRCAFASGDSTATFIGDPVSLAGSASSDGYPTIQQAAASGQMFGVVVGFEPDFSDLETKYRVASTARYAQVCPALDVIFEIQSDDDVEAADVGNTADFTVPTPAGSTTSGVSLVELDSSDVDTGGNLHIMGIVDRADNEAASNFTKVLVRLNESVLRGDGTKA